METERIWLRHYDEGIPASLDYPQLQLDDLLETAARKRLLLIRHSISQPAPGAPPHQWALSDAGRQACRSLATQLVNYDLAEIITSTEVKAAETGQIMARQLSLPCHAVAGLQEQARSSVPYLRSKAQFMEKIELLFEQPASRVFGEESANEALVRFSSAIDSLLTSASTSASQPPDLAIVTHGTVIALFVGRHSKWDPLDFWRRLGMPAIVEFHTPAMALQNVIFHL